MSSLRSCKRCALVLLAALLAQAPLARAALIGFQPNVGTAIEGTSVAIDLVVSGLGEFGPDSLGAFDISVGFDPSALAFTGYSLGGFLGDPGLLEAIDASSGGLGGAVNVAEVSLLGVLELDALQPGTFTLATLNFDVIDLALGSATQLSVLAGPLLGDALGAPLAVTGLGSASIAGSVPVPGSQYLVLASLLAWLALARHRPLLR